MRAQDELGELDRVRITLMSGDMKKFTNLFSQLENVDFHDCENLTGLDHFNKERKNWKELENLSAKAMSVVTLTGAMDAVGFGAGGHPSAGIPAGSEETLHPHAGNPPRSPSGRRCAS